MSFRSRSARVDGNVEERMRRLPLDDRMEGLTEAGQVASLAGGGAVDKQPRDQPVRHHIEGLVKEEHALYGKGSLSEADQRRLNAIKVELDQCWDLLRQRRALREFGKDPDKAIVRSKETVEGYEQ